MEQVLVFPEAVFEKFGKFTGVSREALTMFSEKEFRDSLTYQPRAEMETNPAFKQIIPYCVIVFPGSTQEKDLFFVYQRTKKGGESRLHDKWSIGVGGHVNPCDGEPSCSFESAMLRELQEEVSLCGEFQELPIGAIYDDSNEVGKVHFGVVMIVTIKNSLLLKPIDPALQSGSFVTMDWLKENVDKFENWSQLVIKELI